MIEIEKGVPMPRKGSGRPPSGTKHRMPIPFGGMGVGDSVLVTDRPRQSVASIASAFGKRWGMSFATRDAEGGVRVWRIA